MPHVRRVAGGFVLACVTLAGCTAGSHGPAGSVARESASSSAGESRDEFACAQAKDYQEQSRQLLSRPISGDPYSTDYNERMRRSNELAGKAREQQRLGRLFRAAQAACVGRAQPTTPSDGAGAVTATLAPPSNAASVEPEAAIVTRLLVHAIAITDFQDPGGAGSGAKLVFDHFRADVSERGTVVTAIVHNRGSQSMHVKGVLESTDAVSQDEQLAEVTDCVGVGASAEIEWDVSTQLTDLSVSDGGSSASC